MRLVIQRVSQAGLSVEDKLIAKIGEGLLVLVGFHKEDKEFILDKMLQKFANIHYFGEIKICRRIFLKRSHYTRNFFLSFYSFQSIIL